DIPCALRDRLPRQRIESRGPCQGGAEKTSAIHGSLLSTARANPSVKVASGIWATGQLPLTLRAPVDPDSRPKPTLPRPLHKKSCQPWGKPLHLLHASQ